MGTVLLCEDYGKSMVHLNDLDTFFVDTNFIVAYLIEKEEFHKATYVFLAYLDSMGVQFAVSEVVISEAVNTLAKVYYIMDEYEEECVRRGGEPKRKRDRKRLKWEIGTRWYSQVVKGEVEKLRYYNAKAAAAFEPFLDMCDLVVSSDGLVRRGIRLSVDAPLASKDAMIFSSALDCEAQGILSLDKDFIDVDGLAVLSTRVRNEEYDHQVMIEKLGIEGFLREQLGDAEFEAKFPGLVAVADA